MHCPWSSVDGPHSLNLVHFTPGFLSGLSVASVPSWMHRNLFCSFQTSLDTGNSVGGSIHLGVSCSNLFSRVLLLPSDVVLPENCALSSVHRRHETYLGATYPGAHAQVGTGPHLPSLKCPPLQFHLLISPLPGLGNPSHLR